ncbi:hypothetical protein L211DRAFT_832104 [Terfezia boudieri ATCC MYA-4762]|uniref:18S rRNA factor 2 n=1 Tax=Terfezia boudieri ATCC MYA-4762 TaxID=1051890 RepID=A0A3N4MB63_9PEZI|nr:hypothetical protein L211DRAFT_832104 [Terfezia boudieri ATCC MYA-4762]
MALPRAEDLFGLDGDDDDAAASLSTDDEQDESRTTGASRGSKRRRVTHSSSGSGNNNASSASNSDGSPPEDEEEEEEEEEVEEEGGEEEEEEEHPTSLQPLTPSQLAASRLATKNSGVVYISRVPPFMRPQKVKSLLSRFGSINRIFLSPEDPTSHSRRVKFGGNKKTLYEEGWVEFTDKKVAKLVAETLNATIIGGKKGSYYHDDVWNIKYLPKFKWHHLTAQIAHENAARQSRLRAEIAQAHRENKAFTRNVERAKMIDNMQESRKRKAPQSAGAAENGGAAQSGGSVEAVEVRRQFRQNKVKGVKAAREEGVKSSEGVKKAMAKLF